MTALLSSQSESEKPIDEGTCRRVAYEGRSLATEIRAFARRLQVPETCRLKSHRVSMKESRCWI
jgi:hypothetical protein